MLNEIKTHNDIADSGAHIDWGNAAKIIGQDKVDSIKAAFDGHLKYSTARIGIDLGGSGISVQPDTTTKGPHDAAVPSLLSVNNFSFKADGLTYAVTAGKDSTVVGTKDGQAWKTWQITPNHAGKVNGGAQAVVSQFESRLATQGGPTSDCTPVRIVFNTATCSGKQHVSAASL